MKTLTGDEVPIDEIVKEFRADVEATNQETDVGGDDPSDQTAKEVKVGGIASKEVMVGGIASKEVTVGGITSKEVIVDEVEGGEGRSANESDVGQEDVNVATAPIEVIVNQARKGLVCPHCGAMGINGTCKLLLHIERMHSRPFTCTICQVEFADRYFYNQHSPTCYYVCPVDGCTFKEKRESRLAGHLRRYRDQDWQHN